MRKIGKVTYSVDTNTKVGRKTFMANVFFDEDNRDYILKVMITSSKIGEFNEKYAVLKNNEIYDMISVLDRSTFYNNLIYSFPFSAGSEGGVKMLNIRIDSDNGQSKQVKGVIALAFFSPISNKSIQEKDRNSVFYYFQPIQFLSISNQLKEILIAHRASQFILTAK